MCLAFPWRLLEERTDGLASDLSRFVASRSSPHRVHVEQLQASCFQPLLHNPGESLQHFVAEVVVLLALRSQTLSVKGNGAHTIDSPGMELPLKRRQEPRPSQELSDA